MSKFQPYANEADVLNIGRLSVENRLDRITVSGDLDLTADQQGLAAARRLHDLLGEVVRVLEQRSLPVRLAAPAVKTVDNPFD
jgi:hypothetical protein